MSFQYGKFGDKRYGCVPLIHGTPQPLTLYCQCHQLHPLKLRQHQESPVVLATHYQQRLGSECLVKIAGISAGSCPPELHDGGDPGQMTARHHSYTESDWRQLLHQHSGFSTPAERSPTHTDSPSIQRNSSTPTDIARIVLNEIHR